MKKLSIVITTLIAFNLAGCSSITRRLEAATNAPSSYVPAATTDKAILQSSPSVDLTKYKPVQSRANQRKDIAIAIATSGGGYRAANFAAGVLMGLENMSSPYLHNNLLQEVDYFSSVSGGGFAVGFYESSLYNYWYQYHNVKNPPPYSFTQIMQGILRSDKGVSLVSRNVLAHDYTDFLFFGTDRGLRLEENMNNNLLHTPNGGLTLGDIFVPKKSARPVVLPYWVTNTTIYQNSDLFPISPDILAQYKIRGYWHDKKYQWMKKDFNDPDFAANFPVAVGVTASASVPFVFPSTTLTSQACTTQQCYLQLLDGGLSDNLGVFSAMNFLYQDPAKIKVLIIVDASNSSNQPFSVSQQGPSGFPLLGQIFNMTTDALRDHIRNSIKYTAKDILCARGAKNVVIVYLNLAQDPAARAIGTSMRIAPQQQRYLIKLGKEMTQNNAQLKQFLDGLTLNGLNTDACPTVKIQPELSMPH